MGNKNFFLLSLNDTMMFSTLQPEGVQYTEMLGMLFIK